MFAVIFEVQPKKERWDDYLSLATQLRPRLEAIDGFIAVERFRATQHEGKLLSLSIWRDEKALVRWRTQAEHHRAQEKGRLAIFEDYRIRVGEVAFDAVEENGPAPRQQRFDETETGDAKALTVTEVKVSEASGPDATQFAASLALDPKTAGFVSQETYDSIYTPGKFVLLAAWKTGDAARLWRPAWPEGPVELRHRVVRVIRDYGMFERSEAPQFYEAVERQPASSNRHGRP